MLDRPIFLVYHINTKKTKKIGQKGERNMKKKILVILTILVMAFTCAFALTACGGDNVEGTYYVYENGEKQEGGSMKLDDGKVTVTSEEGGASMSFSGTYTVDGKTVKITISMMGVSSTQTLTVVSDGVLKSGEGEHAVYFCKDGKTPPKAETNDEE